MSIKVTFIPDNESISKFFRLRIIFRVSSRETGTSSPQVPTPLELLPPSLACARFALNSAYGSGFALFAVTVRPPPVTSAAQWLHCFFYGSNAADAAEVRYSQTFP